MGDSDIRKPGRRRRRGKHENKAPASTASPRGLSGGRYHPLSAEDVARIDAAARSILTHTGMGDAPRAVIDLVTAAGGDVDDDGRLKYSPALIERGLEGIARGESAAMEGKILSHAEAKDKMEKWLS